MKCVIWDNSKVERLSDEVAARLVNDGYARYTAKATWKEQVRNPAIEASKKKRASSKRSKKSHDEEKRDE